MIEHEIERHIEYVKGLKDQLTELQNLIQANHDDIRNSYVFKTWLVHQFMDYGRETMREIEASLNKAIRP